RAAAEPLELCAHPLLMQREKLAPPAITQRGDLLGRTHDVRKQNGREHTVDLAGRSPAGHELLDLDEHVLLILAPHPVVDPGEFQETGARDPIAQVSPRSY